jgi:hypothetical protein
MPLAITVPEPSEVIFPPEVAEVPVILIMSEVVKVGFSSFLQEWKIAERIIKLKPISLTNDFMNDNISIISFNNGYYQI